MYLFYQPEINSDIVYLSADESRHCIRVMRFSKGDLIHLTDGTGNLYEAILEDDSSKACRLQITKTTRDYGKRLFSLHIAIAIPKNPSRFEWFLEKSTETGIDRITPLVSEKSEKKNFNMDRALNILVSSIKQSNRAYLPHLSNPLHINELTASANEQSRYIASCFGENRIDLKKDYLPGNDVLIMIGPEGDFSEKEMSYAIEKGFKPVMFGQARLRTETAALVACMTINILNDSL